MTFDVYQVFPPLLLHHPLVYLYRSSVMANVPTCVSLSFSFPLLSNTNEDKEDELLVSFSP